MLQIYIAKGSCYLEQLSSEVISYRFVKLFGHLNIFFFFGFINSEQFGSLSLLCQPFLWLPAMLKCVVTMALTTCSLPRIKFFGLIGFCFVLIPYRNISVYPSVETIRVFFYFVRLLFRGYFKRNIVIIYLYYCIFDNYQMKIMIVLTFVCDFIDNQT